jgi:CDP-glycerol glycerophosphotransferase
VLLGGVLREIIVSILKFISSIITHLILFFPHHKKYYVFTSKYGFSDNTKYLFLYYLEREANCIWVASDDDCFSELEKVLEDYPYAQVVKRNSFKLLSILAKAKYAFVTHSFSDFGVFVKKSCPVINLWHGIPIKKMGYDSQNDLDLFSLDLKNPYEVNDFIISSSETTKPFLTSCMKLPSDRVLPLGQPRNDFLFENKCNENLISKLKSRYSHFENARIFLYAPTFRDKNNLSISIYRDLISSFTDNSQVEDILVLRLHPKEKALLKGIQFPANVKLSLIADVQEELLAADILISDYSGIIFDYSVLARPILLYTPDKDNYFLNRSGSYFEYDQIVQECIHINTSKLTSIWETNFKERVFEFETLKPLHRMFASKNIYDKFY